MKLDKDLLKEIIISKMSFLTVENAAFIVKTCKFKDTDDEIGSIGEHIECLCDHYAGKTFKCYVRKDVYIAKLNEKNAVIFEK